MKCWFLLFVPTPLVILYYSGLDLRGSADDHTPLWTVVLAEYVYKVGAMFVINARDGACPSYNIYDSRFYHVGDSLLFQLPPKILDTLENLRLYNFASHMSFDLALTSFPLHHCRIVDCGKTAVRDWLVSYNFPAGKVYILCEKELQAKQCFGNIDEVPTTVTLNAVPVTFCDEVSRVNLTPVRHEL